MTKQGSIIVASMALMVAVALAIAGMTTQGEQKGLYTLEPNADNVLKPMTLADWIISGRKDFVLLDMRSQKAYDKAHIKQAVNCGSCHGTAKAGRDFARDKNINLYKNVVFYNSSGKDKVTVPELIQDNRHVYFLEGGYKAWKEKILKEIKFDSEKDSDEVLAAKKKRLAMKNFFLGKTIKAPKIDVKAVKIQSFHRPMADEGC